jgi:hypothetical protein
LWGDIARYEDARDADARRAMRTNIMRRVYPKDGTEPHPISSFRRPPPDRLQRALGISSSRLFFPPERLAVFRTVDEARDAWESQPADWCNEAWGPVMYSLLMADLDRACMFLHASNFVSRPTWSHVEAVAGHVSGKLPMLAAEKRRAVAGRLVDAMVSVLESRDHPSTAPTTWAIPLGNWYNILRDAETEQLARLHHAMEAGRLGLECIPCMVLASRLSEDPTRKKLALDIFEKAVGANDGAADARAAGRQAKIAQKILTKILMPVNGGMSAATPSTRPGTEAPRSRGRELQITPDHLWDFSLRTAFPVNEIHVTALMQSLFLGHDGAWQAWRVFDTFTGHGIPASRPMKAVLLEGSKNSGDRRFILRALSTMASDPDEQPLTTLLRNNILHAFFTLSFTQKSVRFEDHGRGVRPRVLWSYPIMLALYRKLFAVGPLLDIIPPSFEEFLSAPAEKHKVTALHGVPETLDALLRMHTDGPPMPPSQATLHIMIMSFLLSVRSDMRAGALLAFYGHFRSLLTARHPLALALVRNDASRVHDSIIKVLGNSIPSARASLDIISDMLHEAGHAREPASATARPPHPRPTKWTWNILLDSWLRKVSQDSAGSIVGMMRKHGVNPNLVTWNTIMMRAATERNTVLAVRAAQRIRETGFEPDAITMQAFSMLHDKEEFLALMQNPPEESDEVEDAMKEVFAEVEESGAGEDGSDTMSKGRRD